MNTNLRRVADRWPPVSVARKADAYAARRQPVAQPLGHDRLRGSSAWLWCGGAESGRCYRTSLADRQLGLAVTGALQPLASATAQCVWAADLHFVGHPGGTGPRLAVKAHACRAGAVDDAAFGFLQVALHCLHMAPRRDQMQQRSQTCTNRHANETMAQLLVHDH